tara:strand:+ start:34575 stop:34814 length:240 start_codon:yes stop_codon:yes gene_type:complete
MTAQAKHKIKRRIMLISYGAIVATLIIILFTVFNGDDVTAGNLTAAQGIIISILAFLTAIVGTSLGITHHDNMKNGHDD